MKRFILVIVALAFAAVLSSTNLATAKPGKSGGSDNPGNKKTGQSNEPKVVDTIHPIEKELRRQQGPRRRPSLGPRLPKLEPLLLVPRMRRLRLLQRR
jgi:hypothetical protein